MALKLTRRGKIWYLRGAVRGVYYYESTGTDSREHAEIWRIKREREILDREYLGEANTATFAEAVLVYLEKGGEARYLAPLTARWGEKKLSEITPAEVSKAARELKPGRKPSTVHRHIYVPLNAVMAAAHEAKMAPLYRFKPPKYRREPVQYADDRWFAMFFNEAHFRIAALVLFLTNSGARVTEACMIRPEDILADTLEVILRMTKNGKPRRIPVDDVTLAALETAVTHCAKQIDKEIRVFGYSGRRSVNQAIERVCDRINIRAEAIVFDRVKVKGRTYRKRRQVAPLAIRYLSSHKSGRHAFAARLLGQGKSLKLVKDAGGWATIRIVAEVYGHLERSETDKAVREAGRNLPAIPAPKEKPSAEQNGAKSVQTRKRPAKRRG